ncbi:PREDICTED: alpha-tocopherol transfer protein-like [Vollenhovia emeryi]|uniref:alpha-tocopherol transfer protein-like n=1 Tax=Vollenhovia emeryi TaxID=411798 RepID=UPI0005F3B4D5|nr:PREDICTED: alpha-tocopherol transfer protein-like [Vollenhovia emeryi]XP_011877601.1 PREDICTED: alpha-tocopherol transfer protein-like [Vollenhovia emeryi]XP_011877602.1 PREDICTED: alpha-tocopherol transfer protein-like [Vollenhovia emeryi]
MENIKPIPSLESISIQELYDNWEQNAPKIKFGEHQLFYDIIGDVGEFLLEKAKKELRETPEVVAKGFKELKELISEEPDLHVPKDMEDFLIVFLRPCKWYAESAFSLMQRYYRFRQTYSHLYKDLSISKEKTIMCAGLVWFLPLRTKDGCRVVVFNCGKWDPKEISVDQCIRGWLVNVFMAFIENKTQIAGVHFILDVEGTSFSQLRHATVPLLRMLSHFLQRCMPFRIKGVHLVNQSRVVNVALALMKPFMEEKYRKRIYTHGINWESLMTHIDKRALPKKYGGEIEMPEEQYCVTLWQSLLYFEPAFVGELQYEYKTDKDKM